jgi:uncharacterized DUF497 family protein
MDLPRFDFDFSFLDVAELKSHCITTDEVVDVFYNSSSIYNDWHDTDGFGYVIGYSLKNKFISVTFELNDDTIRLISVYLSYEPEIRGQFYNR